MTLDRLLVIHCAPTLANLKCSSLVCLNSLDSPCLDVIWKLTHKGLSFMFLSNRKGCPLLFLYRREGLEKALQEDRARILLEKFGYDCFDLDGCLARLSSRLLECEFPHEIGIFLGYPAGDVEAFIINKGENFLSSGYWKVYEDVESAQKTFRLYERCRCVYARCYENGSTIERLCV